MERNADHASPTEIIASVVKCFRDGVCIVDRSPNGFIAYAVDPESKVSPLPKPVRNEILL
jgi:hypothetical protein